MILDKEVALAALAERKASAPEPVDNASLPAGSPMYYYCRGCGALVAVKDEGWYRDPPPKLCDDCAPLKEAGWIE